MSGKKIMKTSLAAVLAASAIVPVASAEAAQQFTFEKVVVAKDGKNLEISFDLFNELLGDVVSTADLRYVTDNAGNHYDLALFNEYLSEYDGDFDKTITALAEAKLAVTDVTVQEGFVNDKGELVGKDETPSTELKVASVSATNNTTVTVKLAAPYNGEVKAEDFTIAGLNVTNATVGTGNDTVILTTSAQEADKEYELAYKGEATGKKFVGKAAEGQTFAIESAEAKSNTEVIVVLDDAPLKNLSATDFQINGLEVTHATTNNNVVTLRTTPQTGGVEYTVTTAAGTGSAPFTGLAAVDTAGVIADIKVENFRQLKIEFKQPVNYETAKNLENYYVGLTKEFDGKNAEDLQKFDETNWEASYGDQKLVYKADGTTIDGEKSQLSYIIIEATENAADAGLLEALGFKENESVTVETRGLRYADGSYTHNSKGSFVLADKVQPIVEATTQQATINDKKFRNANNVIEEYKESFTTEEGRAYVEVNFDEPVQDLADVKGFKVYINGVEVSTVAADAATANVAGKPFILESSETDKAIAQESTVDAHRTMLIDVTDLEKDTDHTIKIVGAKDLNNNVLKDNPYQSTFQVKDEVKEAPNAPEKAKVTDIKQVGDNVLEIHFDQPNVVATADGAVVATIKGADYVSETVEAKDLDITADKVVVKENTPGKTVWVVDTKAKLNQEDSDSNDGSVTDFLGQNEILRTVEVKNYAVKAAVTANPKQDYYFGDTYRKAITMELDEKAPEFKEITLGEDGKSILVTFTDAPFEGGEIALGEAGNIVVSHTNKDGKTEDVTFTVAGGTATGPTGTTATLVNGENTLKITLGTEPLLASTTYTVNFGAGTVKDADEKYTGNNVLATPTSVTITAENLKGDNAINAFAKSITTPKAGEATTAEGLVPQTSEVLIASGLDTAKVTVTSGSTVNVDGDEKTVGTAKWFAKEENKNKVIVVFDGAVLEASALNKGNYKFNDKALPKDAKVTFYKDHVNTNTNGSGDDVDAKKDGFVIIELPAGSVQSTGLYTVEVFNVTNEKGKLMLPVKTAVQLQDNTAPSVKAVKAIGSKQIELTLDENVTVEADAHKNFEVTVNGQKYEVVGAKAGTSANKVVLETSANFTLKDAKVVVKVKGADQGKVHVKDAAGNGMALGTYNN